jgi:hypothetical protein
MMWSVFSICNTSILPVPVTVGIAVSQGRAARRGMKSSIAESWELMTQN